MEDIEGSKPGKNGEIAFPFIISEISRITRKNHLSYLQLKYIFKEVRKKCNLKAEKNHQAAKEHLSVAEGQKLIDLAYTLKGDLGIMVKTLLFTGARINEFVNIQFKDVYLEERKIYLAVTKGDKPRFVPIFDFYWQEIKLYMDKENRTTGYLFESTHHDKYSTRRIQQIIKKLILQAEIDKRITPHRLRGTIAVWLKEKDVSLSQIQAFLGHSNQQTTEIYTQGAIIDLQGMGKKLVE